MNEQKKETPVLWNKSEEARQAWLEQLDAIQTGLISPTCEYCGAWLEDSLYCGECCHSN